MFDKAISTVRVFVPLLPWIILSAFVVQIVHDIVLRRLDLLDMLHVVAAATVSAVLFALVLAVLFNTED